MPDTSCMGVREHIFKNITGIGTCVWRTSMSRIRYNFKILAPGVSAQYQEVVVRMGACTRVVGAAYRERQLERRRLERERQCPGRQQVERRQPGLLSQLLWFSRFSRGSFAFNALLPAPKHSAHFFDIREQSRILWGREELVFPGNLQKEPQDIKPSNGFCEQGEFLLGRHETR